MLLFVEAPSVLILSVAGLVTAVGSLISTVIGARRLQGECEDRLRAVRLEAGDLAEQLYRIKTNKGVT